MTVSAFCRAEDGDAQWRLYRLPVVTGGTEPQKGDGIARTWIEDPKVYPDAPMLNDGAGCLRGQWWLQEAVLLKWWGFLVNTCQAFLADQLESSGMATGFGKLSTQKNTAKNLRSH